MDSPASDTPRQSLLAFLGRPSRPRTQAPPAHAHPQPQAQPPSQIQGQGQGNSNSIEQPQLSQQHPQPPPIAAALSQLLPQSPIPSRRQTISATAAVASNNNNTSTSQPAPASPPMQSGSFGNMLRRRRSANNVERSEANRRTHAQNNNNNNNTNNSSGGNTTNVTSNPAPGGGGGGGGTGPTHRIRLVPHLDSVRSLTFEPISRDVRQGDQPLRIGRFTEHSSTPGQVSNKLAFKSKVVSRGHAEVWFENGSFYIKDTKSSSGTFLNHIRLSPPNSESRPFTIKDGDVLQLGVDYQGGTEEMYRCVRIRIELGREWQSGVNAYNLQALQQLKNLANPGAASLPNGEGSSSSSRPAQGRITPRPTDQSQSQSQSQTINSNTTLKPPTRQSSRAIRPKAASKQAMPASASAPTSTNSAVSDCCICLSSVTICQALFIAPCSHAYHYKCIRPLLQMHHPGFSCPLCRTFADLEADVEGGEFMYGGAGVGFGGAAANAVDDQMVVDEEEGYEDEEGFEVVEGDEGGGSNEDRVGQQPSQLHQAGQSQQQSQQQPQRLSQTPEAGAEVDGEGEGDGDGDGDAGAETDTMPEMMGPTGMGGFAGVGGGGGFVTPVQTPLQGQGRVQVPGPGPGPGRRGLIHDPTVDVDPSVQRSRLPLSEDDESCPLFVLGSPSTLDAEVGAGVGVGTGVGLGSPLTLIIEDGDGDGVGELGAVGRGGGSNAPGSGGGGGPVSVATLVNKRR